MDLCKLRNNQQRIVGLDYGERYMGWAISDPTWKVATPLKVLDRKVLSFENCLEKYIKDYGVFAAMVIGLPLRMDGTMGQQAEKVKRFAERYQDQYNIMLWDERTTSKAVKRCSKDKHVDDLAATFMLQGFLDRLQITSLTNQQ